MDSIYVERILAADIELRPGLLAEYAAECGNTTIGVPNPQWGMYAALESYAVMQAFGVFVNCGMAGFAVVLSAVLPHYGVKMASVESLFVTERWRGGVAGARLMKAIEKYAASVGCKAILYSAPAGGQLEAVLGKRLPRTNSIFCKPLAEQPVDAGGDLPGAGAGGERGAG